MLCHICPPVCLDALCTSQKGEIAEYQNSTATQVYALLGMFLSQPPGVLLQRTSLWIDLVETVTYMPPPQKTGVFLAQ